MSPVRLQIIYDPPEAKSPLCVAEVSDSHAIREAAVAAIREAETRANTAKDPESAQDYRAEADYLRRALLVLVHGLAIT